MLPHEQRNGLKSPGSTRVAALLTFGKLAVLGVLAYFLAAGATTLAASYWLARPGSARATATARPRIHTAPFHVDDTQILQRNIFCAACGSQVNPPVVEVPPGPGDTGLDERGGDEGDGMGPCTGGVKLVASLTSPGHPDWSLAAIADPTSKETILYRRGMSVAEQTIVGIESAVVYMQPSGGRVCRLALFEPEGSPSSAQPRRLTMQERAERAADTRQGSDGPPGALDAQALDNGITKVSDTQYTIQRSLVDNIIQNQAAMMRTARVIPHSENGQIGGVKLYGIRRNSLLDRIGIQNGDLLRTINGFDMASPDSALQAYARLRTADHLTISIERRGQPTTLNYTIQ